MIKIVVKTEIYMSNVLQQIAVALMEQRWFVYNMNLIEPG